MKVAKIIDNYTLVITKRDGPFLGLGDILCVGTEDVTDPETGEVIGQLDRLRVRITEVHDNFVVAETYRMTTCEDMRFSPTVTVNIGDPVTVYPRPAF